MNQTLKVLTIALITGLFFLALPGCAEKGPAITAEEIRKIESALLAAAPATPRQPRKLLVFTRTEGYRHASIPYITKALELMGVQTGAFEIVVSDRMSAFQPENLRDIDGILFNNSTGLTFDDPALRQSLLDFAKGGKGIIGIHAATDNFFTWPEGAALMGGLFDGHPWTSGGTWRVHIEDPEHPVVAAFKGQDFSINDEIYRQKAPFSRVNQRVLLSLDMTDPTNRSAQGVRDDDTDIPMSWVHSYGQGRVFYTNFGHNKHLVWTPAILQHYLAGIQYALGDLAADATPSVTLDDIMAGLAGYDYGQSRLPLTQLNEYVRSAHISEGGLVRTEQRLVAFLQTGAPLAAQQFVCRQLSIIGTEASAPALSGMLADGATSDMARYALERIPGAAVDKVLREALPRTSGNVQAGTITSLGERGDAGSVGALADLISDSNPTVAAAAVAALGRIGGPAAAQTLKVALDRTSGSLRTLALDAYLKCADGLAAAGDRTGARAIYQSLYAVDEPGPIRGAALRGLVLTAPSDGVALILTALRAGDATLQPVAIGLLDEIDAGEDVSALVTELPRLPSSGQVQLLAALARRGDKAHQGAALQGIKSEDAAVREAALAALAALGDAEVVGLLAQRAALSEGREQAAARTSLYRVRGPQVDDVIIGGLAGASPEVQVELIQALDRRRIDGAVKVLVSAAQDGDSRVRVAALRALKGSGTPRDLSSLLALLAEAQDQAERDEARQTVVVVSRKIVREDRRANAVLKALKKADQLPVRLSLLQALGEIEDAQALPTLEKALSDPEAEVVSAAIRALSAWPTAAPLERLLTVARSSSHEVHQILALRGVVRLTGLASDRPEEKTLALYGEALSLAANDNERKVVLAGIGGHATLGALEMALGHMAEPSLQQEAEAAVLRIAEEVVEENPEAVRAALQRVLQSTANENTRSQAQEILDEI